MKKHGSTFSILMVIGLVLTACGAGTAGGPTVIPASTRPPTQIQTPTSVPIAFQTVTSTAFPTYTPSPVPGKIYGKIFVEGTHAPIVTEIILGEVAVNALRSTTTRLFKGANFFTGDPGSLDVLTSTKISQNTDADGSYAFEGLRSNAIYKLFVVLAADNPAFSACKTISLPSDANWTFYVTFVGGHSKPPVPAGEVLKELKVLPGDTLERNLAIPCNSKGGHGSFTVKIH